MGVRTQPCDRNSIEDDSEQQIGSISLMISNLRSAFLKEDFDRVEEALIARETKLTREIKKLEEQRNVANNRYEVLLEEVKKGMNDGDEDGILELRRKNEELEEENGKLKVLLESKYKKLEGNILRLAEDTSKLIDMERSDNGGMFVNASISNHSGDGPMEIGAQGSPLRAGSLSEGNGDDLTPGLRKSSPGNTIVIIDSDDDSACVDSVQKKPSEKPEDNDSLSLTSVEKKSMGLKRKRSLSSSDNENNGDNFGQEFSPTSEMKLHLKSSLEPSCFPVNQCSDTIVASDINNPRSCNALISRQDVERIGEEQNPQSFLRSLSEMRTDWDSSDSSTSTSSSSDDDGLAEIVSKGLQEAKESKARGNDQPAADSRE